MADRPTFYILDAYSLIFQVFHAIPEMTSPTGGPTNAAFGIFRDVLNLFRDRKPDYIAAAFDGGGPVFRSEIFADYKSNRPDMPINLVPQIDVIRRIFEGFNVPVLVEPGMEADDVIATLARRGEERGLDVFICTSDKDARQLISDHVKILNIRKNTLMDEAALEKEWGIRPGQVVDFLALTGDAVDNVPGVPGIGPILASGYLKQFGDLETLLANPDKVKGPKKQQALRDNAEVARRARSLVALRDDLELALDWNALQASPPNAPVLREICVESGFHRFAADLSDSKETVPDAPKAEWVARYSTIDTPESFQTFVQELRKQPRFCIDAETTSINPLLSSLVGIAVSWNAGEGFYIPLRAPIGFKILDPEMVLDALRPILADPEVEKVGQNLKYDMLAFRRAGVSIEGPITDTMILSYLLESGERNHSLDQLSDRLLGHKMIPISDLIGKGKKQLRMDQIDVPRIAEYAGEDADATWRVYEILAPRVREEGLWDLYADLERPLVSILMRMEEIGVMVDVHRLKELSDDFAVRLAATEEEIHKLAGRPFNINSVPQLRQILFEELKLPKLQKTPGGELSTATEVLEELASKHPLPALLVRHRQLTKLKGTYLDALPLLAHPDDGRIHASFNQGVAATGRLSSSDPNLQNIPVRTEEGRQIRQAFVAEGDDQRLLTADYSQIELRVLAHFSQDPALCKAFEADHDIHRAVAARIYGVAEDQVDDTMRRVAKTVNFGVIYGLSPFGLAGRLGIKQSEAAAFIDAYFQEYQGVDQFITRTLESAQASGRVETILGRRRPIAGIKATTGRNRNLAERTAVNTVIQGSAADLIKRAMILVDRRLREERLEARMILQIHDELVFESPVSELPRLAALVREEMTRALSLAVPLKVDLAVGRNWLDVETPDY
ncbi:DNA polymerase I [Planctomyces sp. SH-PL62]|uniref:DNA polymerase I n=1 Tax=Planctomyces sp. SH-PL62 TaxID=1636152 RepID=UPI00078B8745|nr:DNA polymerase I [Planctomyces sp. SH-PL62]AMV39315.1 DNA polymerase I [Planctomyces sp. SH-PL62]